jgi:hypothetical protein
MMLRETHAIEPASAHIAAESVLDPDDYFKLSANLRRLLDRVSVPRRWTREEVREVQKSLKEIVREMDRQSGAAAAADIRASAVRQARAALTMSVNSVPTPAWFLCLLAAWESLSAEPLVRRAS